MLTIERYKGTRFWAVFRDGELLAITVYKRGGSGHCQDAGSQGRVKPPFSSSSSS